MNSFKGKKREELVKQLDIYSDRLESAMEIGDLAWWEMELPSGQVDFNDKKARMLGYDPSLFEHYSDFTELLHPEDKERAMKSMRDHLEGRAERYEVEYRIKTKNDEYKWFKDVGGITETEGEYKKITGIFIDITDRKVTQEREKMLHSLLRHDIRNKIQVVHGYLELLMDMELPNQAERYIDKSRNGITESIDIIKKVSSLREAQEEEIYEVDVDLIAKNAVKTVKPFANDNKINIEVDSSLNGTKALAGDLLKQVFTNILENAIQHSKGTKIRISTEETDQKIITKIMDNGRGIPDEKKEKIFNRTFTTDSGRGTGLGLFLVETVISTYGGEIEVHDSELGGALFKVILNKP